MVFKKIHLAIVIGLITLLISTWFWIGIGDPSRYLQHGIQTLGSIFSHLIIVISILYILYQSLKNGLNWLVPHLSTGKKSQRNRAKTLAYLLQYALKILKWLFVGIFIITCLSEFGIKLTPLFCGLGFAAVPLTLGSKNILQNIMDGILFLFSNEASIGDRIQTNGLDGVIEKLSIYGLTLRKGDGALTYLPFSKMGPITNFNSDYTVIQPEISFPYYFSVQQISQVIKEAFQELNASNLLSFSSEPLIIFLGVDTQEIKVRIKVTILTDQTHQMETVVVKKVVEKMQKVSDRQKQE